MYKLSRNAFVIVRNANPEEYTPKKPPGYPDGVLKSKQLCFILENCSWAVQFEVLLLVLER